MIRSGIKWFVSIQSKFVSFACTWILYVPVMVLRHMTTGEGWNKDGPINQAFFISA